MQQLEYAIILHPAEDASGYWVEIPALPGCISFGETLGQAIENAKEAIALHIEGLIAEGQPVPQERDHPQAIIVKVAA